MAKVPNGIERTNVTEYRRQSTDERIIAYSEREREFTFAKKETDVILAYY